MEPKTAPSRAPRRRRNVLLIFAIVTPLLLIAVFHVWRAQDLHAWPLVRSEVSLALPVYPQPLLGEKECFDFVSGIPEGAPEEAYQQLQGCGLAALTAEQRKQIEARREVLAEKRAVFSKMVSGFQGFAFSTEASPGIIDCLKIFPEFCILEQYDFQTGVSTRSARAEAAAQMIRLLTHGAGILGRTCALQNVMLYTRETIMESTETQDPYTAQEVQGYIEGFRRAEDAEHLGRLENALREDYRYLCDAAKSIYREVNPQEWGQAAPQLTAGETPRFSAFTAWLIRFLEGSYRSSHEKLTALFSHLVSNASVPYQETGMISNLPKRCVGLGKRPPSTRDPVAVLLADSYMRHAMVAGAVDPSIRLELRAARIAVALRFWRDRKGAYPETLDALCREDGSILTEKDLLDPFAPAEAPRLLGYRRDGDTWRLWSVGIDQEDGQGLVDLFTDDTKGTTTSPDLVFTSLERRVRRKMTGGGASEQL